MTGRDRNRAEAASGHSTMLAALVAGHVAAARSFGMSVETLLARAKLRAADLEDPDGRVPLERFVALWSAIQAQPGADEFGFWFGRSFELASLGVVGFAMQHAALVRDAFACLHRFRRLINDVISPEIEERDEHVVFRRREPPQIARLAALAAATPVGTIALLRELTGVSEQRCVPVEVAFQHPPPANAARYGAELRCPVVFNAPEMRVVLPRALFDLPLRRPDPGLFAYLEQHAQTLESRLAGDDSAAARTRRCLLELLRDGEPSQREIARRLGWSERTLQRRLRDEETSFAQLLDEVRAGLARMYLEDSRLAVFEVAFLLGFSEPSAFNRAFRRWTGKSPRAFRQSAQTQ